MKSLKSFFYILLFIIGFSSVTINAQPLAVNPTAEPDSVCLGNSVQLYAYASGGSGNYSFQWTSNPPGFNSDLANPVVMPSETTTYSVFLEDGYNDVQGSVIVHVIIVLPDAGPDQTIPYGTSTTLNGSASGGSGNYSFSWQPANMFIDPNIASPQTYNLSSPIVVSMHVIDNELGCGSQQPDEVFIHITGGPLSVYLLGVEPICTGEEVQLEAFALGGSGVYSYLWSSEPPGFYSTQPNPTDTPQQTTSYTVFVDDGYNTSQASVLVTVIPPMEVSINASKDTTCPHEAVELIAQISGGTGNYSCEWTSDPPGLYSNTQWVIVNPDTVTMYYFQVNDGCETFIDSLIIYAARTIPHIFSVFGGGIVCSGSQGAEVSLNGSELGISYELFRESVTTGIIIEGTGYPVSFGNQNLVGIYSIIASNGYCNQEMDNNVSIEFYSYMGPDEICMVTVDSLSGKNVVMWNITPDEGILLYNIYRESSSGGSYEMIGSVDHEDPGIFIDNGSNPLQRSYSYGMKTIDTCDNETTMSSMHTTIHLNINAGINAYNLIWTHYLGFDYQTYYIYRRQLPGGFQLLDSVPNTITSYSDINPPAGVFNYVIEIRYEESCIAQRDNETYMSVLSNAVSTTLGIDEQKFLYGSISTQPNPFSGSTQLSYYVSERDQVILRIFNSHGQLIDELVNEIQNKGMQSIVWDSNNLPGGIYIYKLQVSRLITSGKLVVVR